MYSIYVFCKSHEPKTDQALEEYLADHVFFDDDMVFTRPLEGSETDKVFKTLQINYLPGRSPLTISCHVPGEPGKSLQQWNELLFVMKLGSGSPKKKAVVQEWLEASKYIFMLEFNRDEFEGDDDEAWELVDQAELYIANECEGMIMADTSFYDKKMKKLYKL